MGRDHFEVLGNLGRGGYGEVELARCTLNQQIYAMKSVSKELLHDRRRGGDRRARERAQTERDVGVAAKQWKCPFIVELFAAFQTSHKLYYVFEFCSGGELYELLTSQPDGRFPEASARFYAAEICLALSHLHAHETVHRDVRLENVLVSGDGHIKLADFGCAKRSHRATRASWNFGVSMPEVFYPPEFQLEGVFGKDLDCWQLGVATFIMLSGELPILATDRTPARPASSSEAASAFCSALLENDRATRLGYPGGAARLQGHHFFAPLSWPLLESKLLAPPQLAVASVVRTEPDAHEMQDVRSCNGAGGEDLLWFKDFSYASPLSSWHSDTSPLALIPDIAAVDNNCCSAQEAPEKSV